MRRLKLELSPNYGCNEKRLCYPEHKNKKKKKGILTPHNHLRILDILLFIKLYKDFVSFSSSFDE